MTTKEANRYTQILEAIFARYYRKGVNEINFERIEINQVADELGIVLPKNLGDVLYSFRYRTDLPKAITSKAPKGLEWIIKPAGKGKYKFMITKQAIIVPSDILAETKIPDSTPGVIAKYSMNDE
jgi:hypothetical protein